MPETSPVLYLRRSLQPEDQSAALQACSGMPLKSPADAKSYHDALLFVIAFPADAAIAERAEAEMQRLLRIIEQKQQHSGWQFALQGSGIMHTSMQCQFSAAMTAWLLKRFPGKVIPAESGASPEAVARFFQELLPAAEFQESTQQELRCWSRVKNLCGQYKNAAALQWILQLLDQHTVPALIKDRLYDSLQIFVQLRTDELFSRSFLQLPFALPPVTGRVKGESEMLLSKTQQLQVLDTMRASLCFYCRETDPVTYADPRTIQCFNKGNGCIIALAGMEKEKQLALESYIGFMVFQNGIPVAYGGGWVFGHRCKIGLNIYPPFRGAGSARIFRDVMDVYQKEFGIHRFLVKPYQFGKGNPDGIRSGAFWFYYKLGFRPEDSTLKKLALSEWKKIGADRQYRTSVPVLRQFTGSRVVRVLQQDTFDETDPGDLSSGITAMIRTKFAGNREAALEAASAHLQQLLGASQKLSGLIHTSAWKQWSLLLLYLHPSGTMHKKNADLMIRLLRYKAAGHEKNYQLQLQSCRFLF